MKNIAKHVHCEYHYFEDVLENIEVTEEFNIIVGAIHEQQFSDETFSFIKNDKKNILIQVSEESELPYNNHYDKFHKVFRTYNTNVKFDNLKIFPIPCGPVTLLRFNWHKAGKPNIKPVLPLSERKNDIFFSGQPNSERINCVENLNKIKERYNSHISLTEKFVDGLQLQDYYDMLCNTKISIVPRGVCIDESFRFFESVFCKNIIITSLDFKSEKFNNIWYYQDCPAIIINNWNEISTNLIDDILSKIDFHQQLNEDYYNNKISASAVGKYITKNIK